MTSTDETALLAAIKTQPLERTPRLVYADWLDEHDRPLDGALQRVLAEPERDDHRLAYAAVCERQGDADRAEFVRTQLAIAELGFRTPTQYPPTHRCTICGALWVLWRDAGGWSLCSRTCEPCCDNAPMGDQIAPLSEREEGLFRTEWAILSDEGRKWAGEIIPTAVPSTWSPSRAIPYLALPGPSFVNLEFARGFISTVRCRASHWLEHGDTSRMVHPVTHVELSTRPTRDELIRAFEGRYAATAIANDVEIDQSDDEVIWLFESWWPGVTFELSSV